MIEAEDRAHDGTAPTGARSAGTARLRDGTPVRVRPAEAADAVEVRRFLAALSRDSLERRFFTAVAPERVVAEILPGADAADRCSLLVEQLDPTDRRIIGHGEYVRCAPDRRRAEVAFLVADDRQGLGVGTLLLLHLARVARTAGVAHFEAVVQPDNAAMLDVFFGAGFPCSVRSSEGEGLVLMEIGREPVTAILPWTGDVTGLT